MRTYTILPYAGPDAWKTVPTLSIDQPFGAVPEGLRAFGQLQYDGEKLYVHLWAVEKEIRAEESGILATPCEDSCLEFFFCPKNGDDRYFNIEFNPTAHSYVGFGTGLHDLLRLIPDSGEPLFDPTTRRTADGWEIFYQIPWSFVRRFFPDFKPEKGLQIRANCYKCGDSTSQPHYLTWNEHPDREPGFHFPEIFGTMIFG
ncbi:MAG: carbohydrate-binding family 9-like protein [Oscillospiraceae bacterium]|nr:carbohydrate-binding family 9-like protein [Oscillospiraceae bacterium]MBR2366338.1 carbohydrate-binding family 9-like protein [Oscillospiraceae bacterium]MBR2897279.1 carbohydrate-binding family 9-like protein [Oscillospiraceae bacterium]MBR2978040.1 carbohydrate-binding family 9-like protein [Oscillospiraceae bacterium]MBR3849867.1 carbohydrate-binding family 9-like protein [Oscillospiraceae bacterium]